MNNRGTVLICDSDYAFLNEMERSLSNDVFDVDTIDNAVDLIPSAIRLQPHVILVNPEMPGFNEYDVCKHIIKEHRVQLILLLDADSSARTHLGDCMVEDAVIKPVDIASLTNLLEKHFSLNQ